MTDTHNTPIQFKDYLTIAGITLVILLALPLLAIMGLTLQFGFLIVAPLVLLSAIAYSFGKRTSDSPMVRGIMVPDDVLFDKKHSWFKRNARNHVLIGMDDFAQRIVGTPEKIEIVNTGKHLNKGDALAYIVSGKERIALPSPFKGQVVQVNPTLKADPKWINRSPYKKGWIAEMRPEEAVFSLTNLFKGESARAWMRGEVDRLISIINNVPAQVNCLPDGGEVAKGFAEHLDSNTRQRVVKEFLN